MVEVQGFLGGFLAVSWQKSGKTFLLISHRNQSRSGGESDLFAIE